MGSSLTRSSDRRLYYAPIFWVLGISVGAAVFSSCSLVRALARPNFGSTHHELFFGAWAVGLGLGAWTLGLQRRRARSLLVLAAILWGALAFAAPLLVGDEDAFRVLHLRPQDHGALLVSALFAMGLPAGALLPAFFRRVPSIPLGALLIFVGGALASLFVDGALAAEYSLKIAFSVSAALGALICFLFALVPTRFHKKMQAEQRREAVPIGGPMDAAPSSLGLSPTELAASACPRPRLRPNHAGLLAALLAPWSLLLFHVSLQFGGVLLGTESGVSLEQRLLLVAIAFGSLAVGTVVVPLFLQSDARGASGLLLLQGGASIWLAKVDDLLVFGGDVGLWTKLASWGLSADAVALVQVSLMALPPLAVAGAGIPVLASALVRDEPGRRIGGLLGWASVGSLGWLGLVRLQSTEALALVSALAMIGMVLLEVAPSGGVGRVRNRLVRILGRLGRLTTVALLAAIAVSLSRMSAPESGLLKLRAEELSGLDEAMLSSWRHDGKGLRATFGRSLGRDLATWTPGGRFVSSEASAPSAAFLLVEGLCADSPKSIRVGGLSGGEGAEETTALLAREEWSGRGLWPWSAPVEHDLFDLIWLDKLRPTSADGYVSSTGEALALFAERLAPGGLVGARIDLSSVSREVLDAQLDTFGASFPWSAIWLVDGELCLTGGPSQPTDLLGPPTLNRERLGLDSEASVLGRFIGELEPRGAMRLGDSLVATLFDVDHGKRLLARNIGGVYARATPAPAAWAVRESAVGRLAVQGFRLLGQVRIAKAWVDHYRATAPMSIAQGTWEERLGKAIFEVKSLLPDEPEVRLFESLIRVEDWRSRGLFAIREGEYARAVGPLLQASVASPNRADLQLMLAAALEFAGNSVASEAAMRRTRELSPSWKRSRLAAELRELGFSPL